MRPHVGEEGSRRRRYDYSADWRAGGDWVSQYAPIVAAPFLPTEWPPAIAVDSFQVRVPLKRADGTPVQRGANHYAILGVVGYERPGGRTSPGAYGPCAPLLRTTRRSCSAR